MKNVIRASLLMIMILMTPSLYAQSTTNSIYIEQVGDSSTINIDQSGQGNQIGSEITAFSLNGDSQTVDIDQQGNENTLNGQVNGNNVNFTQTVTGNSNAVDVNIGETAAGGSTLTLAVTGDGNDVDLVQGSMSSATNVTQDIAIVGDFNTFDGTVEADDVVNDIDITGDSNTMTMVQNGYAGKTANVALTGSTNNVSINQTSTLNVDSISLTSDSSNSNITINQCDSGGC